MNARLVTLWSITAIGATPMVRAQQMPPVHPVGAIVAKTKEPITTLAGMCLLSDGRVVVNDRGSRRILLFDSTLTTFKVLMDTSGTTARMYPTGQSILMLYGGDSTVLFDAAAVALVVIDPSGRIVRVQSPPFPPDAGYLTMPPARKFDPQQRALYRASVDPFDRPRVGGAPPAARTTPVTTPDSAPIVRAAGGGAAPDTLAYVRLARPPAREPFITKEGATLQRPVVDPFPVVDDWTMLLDGTIAILRGQDFHIDWVAPNGTVTASPKLPIQWRRLSDSAKVAIVDSVTRYNEAHPIRYNINVNDKPVSGTMPAGVIAPTNLADYRPPFARPGIGADFDGNVWLLPTPEVPLSPEPGAVWEVVNRKAGVIDLVQLNPGFNIQNVAHGFIYMSVREDSTTVIVKAKIR